jgi:hypothetical protein
LQKTGQNFAPEPLTKPYKEPLAAREEAAASVPAPPPQPPEGAGVGLPSRGGNGATPSGPADDTTPDGGGPFAEAHQEEPLDTSAFDAFLAERKRQRATVPLTIEGEVVTAAPEPEDPVGPAVMDNVIRSTVWALRNNPPPRASSLDRWEQVDALAAKLPPKAYYAPDAVLRAARADLAARAAARHA